MMIDIWKVLEVTLGASLTAGVLLAVKALFHDKLNARWHYLIWCVFLVRLLVPIDQRIFTTPLSIFQTIPLPQLFHIAKTYIADSRVWEKWIGMIYLSGVSLLSIYYAGSYLRLRFRIKQGASASVEMINRIMHISEKYQIHSCGRIRVCQFTSSPFVAGVICPVLVLPTEKSWTDEELEEMILHELLHMQYMDVAVNFLLHVIRILNWFNPFLWYVLNKIQNDNEALCDQRVLERLGKGRKKSYGELLFAMTDKKEPPSIGTTSMANGAANIKIRLRRIIDFGHVPKENTFVSLCITLMLVMACIGYASSDHTFEAGNQEIDRDRLRLKAQLYDVSTPQEALNIYMKALKERNEAYMALVLPDEEWEKGEFFFPELDVENRYYMMVLDFSQLGEKRYSAKIGLCQETYENIPKDWQIYVELYQDFDWKLIPQGIEPLAGHSAHVTRPEVLEPVISAKTGNERWEVTIDCYNEIGFQNINVDSVTADMLFGNIQKETFETDFSEQMGWRCVKVRYTGSEDLTGRNPGIRYGSAEALEEWEENLRFHPNGNGSGSSDEGGWSAVVVTKGWNHLIEETSGSSQWVWDKKKGFSYVVQVYLDGELDAEFLCDTGGGV